MTECEKCHKGEAEISLAVRVRKLTNNTQMRYSLELCMSCYEKLNILD